jgi:hypothetical protein
VAEQIGGLTDHRSYDLRSGRPIFDQTDSFPANHRGRIKIALIARLCIL